MTDTPELPTYAQLRERTDAPPGSSWGVFGEGNHLGTLNFLTPERVRLAAAEVRRGAVFNLDYPLDAFPGPVRSRSIPAHVLHYLGLRRDGTRGIVTDPREATDVDVLDDYLDHFYLQSSSHIDALRHVISLEHGSMYDRVSPTDMVAGNPTLGVGEWAERGIVGRGVLVDVATFRESQGRPLSHLEAEEFGPELLEATLAAQGTEVRPGDMLLLRTDCPRHLAAHRNDDAIAMHTAGLAQTIANAAWLWDHQISLIAADNLAVESTAGSGRSDFGDGRAGRLHPQLIPMLGMAVGELWRLDELAADCAVDGVYSCLLVVKPLNLVGGVGSPANATAIK